MNVAGLKLLYIMYYIKAARQSHAWNNLRKAFFSWVCMYLVLNACCTGKVSYIFHCRISSSIQQFSCSIVLCLHTWIKLSTKTFWVQEFMIFFQNCLIFIAVVHFHFLWNLASFRLKWWLQYTRISLTFTHKFCFM